MSLNGRVDVRRELEADRTNRETLKEAKHVGSGNNRWNVGRKHFKG